ncbi:unnamed protein product [Mortierella alpina]
MHEEPQKKSLPFKLGAATFRGIALFFNALYEVMMDHEKYQGEENRIPDRQSSVSPLPSSSHGHVTQERYSIHSKLPLCQVFEDPQEHYSREYSKDNMSPMDQVIEDLQEPYSPMAMDPVVKDIPEPYSLDNSSTMDHPAIQSTSRINEGARDKTEMVGLAETGSATAINVVFS